MARGRRDPRRGPGQRPGQPRQLQGGRGQVPAGPRRAQPEVGVDNCTYLAEPVLIGSDRSSSVNKSQCPFVRASDPSLS